MSTMWWIDSLSFEDTWRALAGTGEVGKAIKPAIVSE